ncbi:SET domain-containing histone-lysine N-methyltransferase [Cystobacter fuscus]|nr:SET domain-containing histone-lysine N-methyltransferase [Cystobacter fuscus]
MSADTAASSSNQKLSNLLRWLEEGGARFPKLQLVRREDGERAVLAQAPISAGETVLQVPRTHMLTLELARESDIGRAIAEGLDPDNEDLYLASFLLQEKHREGSFWKPYIDSLPESYSQMPLFYGSEEHALLKGCFALTLLTHQAQSLREDYLSLCQNVPGYERFTPGEFVWARLSVSSRLFSLKKGGFLGQTLVPMADMLNHRRPPDVLWETTEDGESFVMKANNAVAAGDEVHDSYGAKSNDLMLLHFGFVTDDNEHDEAFLGLRILDGDPLAATKQMLLMLPSPTAARPFKISRPYVHTTTRMAFSFLRIAAAVPNDIEDISSRVMSGERALGPLSVENEENVLELLAATCQARLSIFPTSLAQDEELLRGESLSPNARNCVLVRRAEKQLIEDYLEMTRVCLKLLRTPREEVERLAALSDSPWGWFDAYVRTDLLQLIGGE